MRRSHTKSRNGCTNCKHRKVKCDEARPACFNCRRQQVPCSLSAEVNESADDGQLPSMTPTFVVSGLAVTPGVVSPASAGPSPAEQIAPYPPVDLWKYDLELMHHYVTSTADTLANRLDMCHVWRVLLPMQGYKYPFVTHGILAVAAIHRAYRLSHSRQKYFALSDYHQTLGSEGYRRSLQDSGDHNVMALFAFASTMVLLKLTVPIRQDSAQLQDPIHHLMELASLHRGIQASLAPLIPSILRTDFAPLIYGVWPPDLSGLSDSRPSLAHCSLPQDTWEALSNLRDYFRREVSTSSHSDYFRSLESLETCAQLVSSAGPHVECGAIMVWIHNTPESVLLDIAAHRPHGLLMLAFYSVFWAVIDKHVWYAADWARQLFNMAEAKLMGHEKALSALQWPKQKLLEMGV